MDRLLISTRLKHLNHSEKSEEDTRDSSLGSGLLLPPKGWNVLPE